MDELKALEAVADAAERAKKAGELVSEHQAVIAELSRIRREAVNELLEAGWKKSAIAKHLGIDPARVTQMLAAGPRPERVFLSTTSSITIAVGGKADSQRGDNARPRAVVSAETVEAYEQIAALARALDMTTVYEVVPPPGLIDLNRAGLVVLTSPRLLPFVGQVLAADQHLGFAQDQDGWYLVDHESGRQYRSPNNSTEPVDYAYVGRLPRPDGRGTFLYLAGVHAVGTLGAVQYVVERLPELYREVGRAKLFSQLISVRYDAKSREIASTEPVTPIYRHGG